jgi:hypothetical protein
LHAVPVAFALSRRYPKSLVQDHRLRQACSLRRAEALRALSGRTLRMRVCPCASMRRHGRTARQAIQVPKKESRAAQQSGLFRRLDILVVAELTILLLTDEAGLGHVKFVHTRHGAGDRAGSLPRELAGFDLILTAGSKIRERLIRLGLARVGAVLRHRLSEVRSEEGIVGSRDPH